MYQLSEGSLEIIMNGGDYEKPIVQVLCAKKLPGSGANEKYRLLISDGQISHSFTMLSRQFNDKVISGELSDYSVIQIDGYGTTPLKKNENIRVMVIIGFTIIAPGTEVGQKLGNPRSWTGVSENGPAAQTPEQSAPKPTVAASMPAKPTPNLTNSNLNTKVTHPINSLSPYQNQWVIKARVMSKSPIRTWSNAKGEGKLFTVNLCDESGEIRATAFKNECDKFYEMMQIDKVYYISRCAIKTANKQYSTLQNDYEMTFTSDTVVAECLDDSAASVSVKYNFVPINEIAAKQQDTILDVIGVCKSASDIQELTAKSTGKLLKKREVTIVDSSGGAVVLTLWGNEAETFDGSTNPVLALKGVRLTEFNGSKSLGNLASTMLRLNPDLPEAHKLRGWYDNGGANIDIVNISAKSGVYAGGSNEWIMFSDAESRQLGSGEKGDYYSLLGVLTFLFSDKAIYKACSQKDCNKKLVDQQNGLYRCEKCNREFPDFKYRILLSATVSDPSGDQRVTAFNEVAEAMLGKTAEEIGQMFDYDKNGYAEAFNDVKFKTFSFRFRTKIETYSDEARLKTIIMSAQPLDYKEGNAKLLKQIKEITGVEV